MKWASNFTVTQVETDTNKLKETNDWITWWEAANLWRMPESLPHRQAIAEERCAQFNSRPHKDPIWAEKGIVQHEMSIEDLKTNTKIDTETRTVESYGDLKGSKLQLYGDIDNSDIKIMASLAGACLQ